MDRYDLQDWMNPMMSGSHDIEKRCRPVLKTVYRGIIRKMSVMCITLFVRHIRFEFSE